MSPTPNTTLLRDDARFGHLTQTMARSRNAANAAAFASTLIAGVLATARPSLFAGALIAFGAIALNAPATGPIGGLSVASDTIRGFTPSALGPAFSPSKASLDTETNRTPC